MNQGTVKTKRFNKEKSYHYFYVEQDDGEDLSFSCFSKPYRETIKTIEEGDTIEYDFTVNDKGYNDLTHLKKIEYEFTPKIKKEWKPDHFPGVSKITAEVTCSLIEVGHVDYKNVGPALLVVGDAAWTVALQHEPGEIVRGEITNIGDDFRDKGIPDVSEKESEKETLDVDSMSASELVREIEAVGKDIGKSENLINASTKTDDLVSLRACLTMYLDEQKEQTDLKADKERT